MSADPLVSIVTPCLNPGERLVRCLDSVAQQTHTRVEHIVVDGGSTDGTVDLLRAHGVRFVSEPDEGQAQAINKGFGLANGDWLGWLNADDALTPRSTELAMAAASRNPGAGWIYGRCEIRDGAESSVFDPPGRIDKRALQDRNMLAQPGTLVARWALDRVGPLDEQFDLVMDFDLWLRLLDAGVPAVYVPDVLAVFEIHPDSKTGRVPLREWELENAAAMFKAGHTSDGAALLGRVAARSAYGAEWRVDRRRLDGEIARSITLGKELSPQLDETTVRAAAFAEAAERELFGSPRRYRYFFRTEPWRVSRTRRRLGAAIVARAFRFVVRRPRPSHTRKGPKDS
jgi:GT2 family glycosyltransferase